MTAFMLTMPVHGVYLPDFPWIKGCNQSQSDWTVIEPKKRSNVRVRPVAVCGPSGSGKSTLLKRLLNEHPDCIQFSISHTTRKPRPNETPGVDYHYVSREAFQTAVKKGEFLEHAEFSGNIYGTTKSAVTKIQTEGKLCILDVEMIGVKSLKKTDLNPKFIFIKTPSLQVLEERLRNRNTESEESLQKRLARAKEELVYGEGPGNFDLIVVNDDLEEAYQQLKEFLREDIKTVRNCLNH